MESRYNNSNSNHGGSLDDGDTLHYLLLVDLESGLSSVDLPDNVGHAGLLPHEVGQVDRIGRIILRESLELRGDTYRHTDIIDKFDDIIFTIFSQNQLEIREFQLIDKVSAVPQYLVIWLRKVSLAVLGLWVLLCPHQYL